MRCRHCNNELINELINLGCSPPSNAYLENISFKDVEKKYLLRIMICKSCFLVQTEDFVKEDEMFSENYAYFSSYSKSWLDHSSNYVESIIKMLSLNKNSTVVEIAANDGYLLQFMMDRCIPCYGIEPTHSTAEVARRKGIDIVESFFSAELARGLAVKKGKADLIIANNVLAHVPNINNFVEGVSTLLKEDGVVTFEFPYILNLIKHVLFDTMYHEHYSYLSLTVVNRIFNENGLKVFKVENLSTHGGSLRVYAQQSDSDLYFQDRSVDEILHNEKLLGVCSLEFYAGFHNKAEKIKNNFIEFLLQANNNNMRVAAYGAAAKGNTLMNYSEVSGDLIEYVADKNTSKQGMFMPGSHIPIVSETYMLNNRPDYLIIFPWNLLSEIMIQLSYLSEQGTKFVTVIPEVKII